MVLAAHEPPLFEGRFRLIDKLGEGRLGTVYEADARFHEATVALKVLHREHALHAKGRIQLLDTLARLAQLRHPNVVQILETAPREAAIPHWVMQRHSGLDLRIWLRAQRRLSWAWCHAIAIDVASALCHAHAHGFVQHHLKPKDVMVEGDVEPRHARLLDFGLNRPWRERAHDRRFMQQVVPYLAPEQLTRTEDDPRSDVYSFGIFLFELLSGAPPFVDSDPARVWERHLHERAPRLRERVPELPRDVETLVETCLAKDPADRFTSMNELSLALQSLPRAKQRTRVAAPPSGQRAPSLRRCALLGFGSGVAMAVSATALGYLSI